MFNHDSVAKVTKPQRNRWKESQRGEMREEKQRKTILKIYSQQDVQSMAHRDVEINGYQASSPLGSLSAHTSNITFYDFFVN
jgi:hypothetical protein